MKKFASFLLVLSTIFLFSCNNDSSGPPATASSSQTLFEKVPSSESGIKFKNNLSQDGVVNVFSFNYMMNGGGVATADFNNDGLADLFFTSNQESDRLYLNKGDLKFEDITESAGIGIIGHGNPTSWSTGVTVVDINQDGWMDLYVCKSGPYAEDVVRQNLLFINNKDLTFTEASAAYGIHDAGHSTHATFFDYDNDQDLDLFVLNHSILFGTDAATFLSYSDKKDYLNTISGQLYRNDNQRFSKVTKAVGLEHHIFGLGCIASDLNQDGWVDLYTTSDYAPPDIFFLNEKGKFTNKIKEFTNHISFYAMGVDAADINNDGLLDISVMDMTPPDRMRSKTLMASMDIDRFFDLHERKGFQYQYMINTLQLNQGLGRFSEIAQYAGVHKTDWSWATLLADYDNDGNKDMYVSNGYRYDVTDNDYLIKIRARQKEVNKRTLDPEETEEWLKKLPSHKLLNFAFKNTGNLKFEKANEEWGLTEKSFSNGAVYVDLDNDGDLDLVANNMDHEAFLYKNNASEKAGNNFININLKGSAPNINALNAKVYVHTGDNVQYQELTLSRGYQSAIDKRLHFGLGNNSKIDKIEIIWPNGEHQEMTNVKANQFLNIDKNGRNKNIAQRDQKNIFNKESDSPFSHVENEFNDYDYELLLPHKNSQHGPKIAVADINGDNIEDFYIGGAANQSGAIYLGQANGKFKKLNTASITKDKASEDMDALFFDADQDGDQDLYVVSGGNEFPESHPALQDRLYINDGNGNFSKAPSNLPKLYTSGSKVVSLDADLDGDLDLFVAGRMQPRKYPNPERSALLINEGGKFKDKTLSLGKELLKPGIITAAVAKDIDGDKRTDLILAGEWTSVLIFKNTAEGFQDITSEKMKAYTGWWSALTVADIDGDGDEDLIVGNLGLNYKYKASQEKPFHIYSNDFDNNKTLDIVLGVDNGESVYPLRGRECSSEQMPFIKDKFPTYKAFASANINEVYGEELESSLHLEATEFASCIFKNNGDGNFEKIKLPYLAQLSCTNAIIYEDLDKDGIKDLLLAGNLFVSEVETPRNDAGVGVFLKGEKGGSFKALTAEQSGFLAPKDVKDLKLINMANGQKKILVANNNAAMDIFNIN